MKNRLQQQPLAVIDVAKRPKRIGYGNVLIKFFRLTLEPNSLYQTPPSQVHRR